MLKYVAKRILYLIPTVFLVSVMVFLMIHLIPGDPAALMLGEDATEAEIAVLHKSLGLDKPLPVQYAIWLGGVLKGDFGASVHTKRPVIQSIRERFPVTLTLTIMAMLMSLVMAIPAGVMAAYYHGTRKDYFFMGATILGVSVPGFWLGLVLLLFLSVQMGWFPATGFVSMGEDFREGLRFMLLPAFSLGLYMAAVVARMIRSSMLEVLRLEYVTHARAKGLREWTVIVKHALKNAFAPALTTIGIQFGALLGGAVVTESVFSLPGLGKYIVVSIYMRDYPVVQGSILFLAVVYVLINLLVDLLYGYFDPRIQYS